MSDVELSKLPSDTLKTEHHLHGQLATLVSEGPVERALTQTSEPESEERASQQAAACNHFETEFAFFATAGPVEVRGHRVEVFGLEGSILEKFSCSNACRWHPGL